MSHEDGENGALNRFFAYLWDICFGSRDFGLEAGNEREGGLRSPWEAMRVKKQTVRIHIAGLQAMYRIRSLSQ